LYLFRILTEEASVQTEQHSLTRLFEDVTTTALPQDTSQTRDAQIGDLDGDDDLELVFAHNALGHGRQPQILINNGTGVFHDETGARMPPILVLTNQIELVDVNQDGRLVRTLLDREQPVGEYAVRWDGRNEFGNPAPAGIYFYRLMAGGKTVATHKMMLLGESER
jgi:hypothetical protein